MTDTTENVQTDPLPIVELRRQRDGLLLALKAAMRRVEIANAEGNPILSAWLPDARAAVAAVERERADEILYGIIAKATV